jgi:peptidoglycan/LPS O-acetylase OafA/YrhL
MPAAILYIFGLAMRKLTANTPGNQSERTKIFGLDLMRVAAILLVLSAHILWIYPGYRNLLTKAMNFSGFIGVEIFFVLSGFLIGGSLHKVFLRQDYNIGAARNFLRRRMLRIMPDYTLILVANIIVYASLGYRIVHPWKYFVFLQNAFSPMLPFFPESWSMAIKEIPYFTIPFILLALASLVKVRNRNRFFLYVALLLFFISLAAKFVFYLMHPALTLAEWNISLRSVALYRMDAVMTGVLFAWLRYNCIGFWEKYSGLMVVSGFAVVSVLAALVGIVRISPTECPFFWDVAFLPLISFSCAMSLPFFSRWKAAPKAIGRPVEWLGAVSYFVYLTHYSLILSLMKHKIDTTGFGLWQLHTFTLCYLMITFGLAWLLHVGYEKPVLRFRERKTKDYGTIERPKPDIRA